MLNLMRNLQTGILLLSLATAACKEEKKVTPDPEPPGAKKDDDANPKIEAPGPDTGKPNSGGGSAGGTAEPYLNLSAEDVLKELLKTNDVYARDPEAKLAEDKKVNPIEVCLQFLVSQVPLQASKSSLVQVYDWGDKALDCVKEVDENKVYKAATIKYGWAVTCSDKASDYSQYDGKKWEEIDLDALNDEITACKNPGIFTLISYGANLAGKNEAGKDSSFSFGSYVLKGNPITDKDGKQSYEPCTYSFTEDSFSQTNTCYTQMLQKFYNYVEAGTPDASMNQTNFLQFKMQNLLATAKSKTPWFSEGSIDFLLNDWSGKLTYANDGKSPSYVLKRGDESKSGRLIASDETAEPNEGGSEDENTEEELSLSLKAFAISPQIFKPMALPDTNMLKVPPSLRLH